MVQSARRPMFRTALVAVLSQSDWSEPTSFTVSLAPPWGPEIQHARPSGRRSVDVTWYGAFSPVDPILEYTVHVSPGDVELTVPGSERSVRVPDLAAGEYVMSVSARNLRGSSPAGASQTVYVAPAAPGVVEDLQVEQSEGSATVTWRAPDDVGDSPITGYEVFDWWDRFAPRQRVTETRAHLKDLRIGDWYDFAVVGINENGAGDARVIGFRATSRPGAPADVTARLNDRSLDLSWSPPASTEAPTSTPT